MDGVSLRRWGVRSVGALYVVWGSFAVWTTFTQAGTTSDPELVGAGLIGVAYALVGIAIFRYQRWGLYGSVLLLLVPLSVDVVNMWAHPSVDRILSALLRTALQAIPVLYLLRPGVQSLFSRRA